MMAVWQRPKPCPRRVAEANQSAPTKMNNIDTTIDVATNCVAELLALASGLIDDLESFGSECGDDYRAELQNIVDRFNAA